MAIHPGGRDPLAAFTPAELRKLRSFNQPYVIQQFLDDTSYHLAEMAAELPAEDL